MRQKRGPDRNSQSLEDCSKEVVIKLASEAEQEPEEELRGGCCRQWVLQAVGATRARPNWERAQGEMRPGCPESKEQEADEVTRGHATGPRECVSTFTLVSSANDHLTMRASWSLSMPLGPAPAFLCPPCPGKRISMDCVTFTYVPVPPGFQWRSANRCGEVMGR